MSGRNLARVRFAIFAEALIACAVQAQDGAPTNLDERAIRDAAKSYQAALASGDAKALLQCWTADGEFIDQLGRVHPASELVTEAQRSADVGPGGETKVTSSKIRFLTPDVAMEDGASEVVFPDGQSEPARGHFHATWVKQDGRWRLASLCEAAEPVPAPAQLADLGWLVGAWTAQVSDARLEATVRWNEGHTFLLRDTVAKRGDKVLLRGSQRIGRDPLSGELKSWSFESDGGFSETTWTKQRDSWVGQNNGVRPDRRQTSTMIIITFDGKNSYTQESVAGQLDGAPLPDNRVRFTRSSEHPR
jgi:uncharacterized protein (TIGR02246 family)